MHSELCRNVTKLYFQLCGFSIAALGIYLTEIYAHEPYVTETLFVYAPNVLIILGLFLFLIGYTGGCGLVKENFYMSAIVSRYCKFVAFMRETIPHYHWKKIYILVHCLSCIDIFVGSYLYCKCIYIAKRNWTFVLALAAITVEVSYKRGYSFCMGYPTKNCTYFLKIYLSNVTVNLTFDRLSLIFYI